MTTFQNTPLQNTPLQNTPQSGDAQDRFVEVLEPHISRFSGNVAVACHFFSANLTLTHLADTIMPSASLIKLPIMLELLSQCDVEECHLTDKIVLKESDKVGGSGVLQHLHAGLELSLQDLTTLMIVVSDNTATNMLIDFLGARGINRRIAALGLSNTHLLGKLQLPPERQSPSQLKGAYSHTTAQDMLTLLLKLHNHQIMSDEICDLALYILSQQQHNEALARYLPVKSNLPHNPHSNVDHLVIASKSGFISGVWHDAGLIYRENNSTRADDIELHALGEPVAAMVIMTKEARDTSFSLEHEGMLTIARIAQDLYQTFV